MTSAGMGSPSRLDAASIKTEVPLDRKVISSSGSGRRLLARPDWRYVDPGLRPTMSGSQVAGSGCERCPSGSQRCERCQERRCDDHLALSVELSVRAYSVSGVEWQGPMGRTAGPHPHAIPIPTSYQQTVPVLRALLTGGRTADWPIPRVRQEEVSAAIRGWTQGVRVCMACRDKRARDEVAPITASLAAAAEAERVRLARQAEAERAAEQLVAKRALEEHEQRVRDLRDRWGPENVVISKIGVIDRKLAAAPTNLRLTWKGWLLTAVFAAFTVANLLASRLTDYRPEDPVPPHIYILPAVVATMILTYGWSGLALGRAGRLNRLREQRRALRMRLGCGDLTCERCHNEETRSTHE